MFGRDHEVILGVLAHRGIASSQQLQEATGKSQATVSRLLADLSGQVLTVGRARATRYALPRPIRGRLRGATICSASFGSSARRKRRMGGASG